MIALCKASATCAPHYFRIVAQRRAEEAKSGIRRQRPESQQRQNQAGGHPGANSHVVELDSMLDEYYRLMGWDEKGVPTEARISELGLRIADLGMPQTLLVFAQLLYGHARPATLITVSGFSFAHGENLSPQMTALLPDVLAGIYELLC